VNDKSRPKAASESSTKTTAYSVAAQTRIRCDELTAIAGRSLEEAAEIGESYGLEQALKRFDGDLSWAAFGIIEDLRQAGHAELRRKLAKRHLQLVSRRAG